MTKTIAVLKKWTAMPAVKYSLIAAAAGLWLLGLGEQVQDPIQIAKYVGISLLMAAFAVL